jgi:uncharacterized membrane protein
MNNILFSACSILILFGTCRQTPAPTTVTIKGEYYADTTGRYLLSCADGVIYQVENKVQDLDVRYRQQRGIAPIPGEAVNIVCTGQVRALSEGGATPVFTLQKVDTISVRNRFNTCSAFTFWASGTEPFWSLEISTLRKALFFKDIGMETGRSFSLTKMTQTDNTWTYHSNGPSDNSVVEVMIKKESCSDGMSDIQFKYSCTLSIGKTVYKGCAMKWGEMTREE